MFEHNTLVTPGTLEVITVLTVRLISIIKLINIHIVTIATINRFFDWQPLLLFSDFVQSVLSLPRARTIRMPTSSSLVKSESHESLLI